MMTGSRVRVTEAVTIGYILDTGPTSLVNWLNRAVCAIQSRKTRGSGQSNWKHGVVISGDERDQEE